MMSAKEALVYQRTKRRPEHRCPCKNVRCRRKLKLADFQCRRHLTVVTDFNLEGIEDNSGVSPANQHLLLRHQFS